MRFARLGVVMVCAGVIWCGAVLAQGTGGADEAVVSVVRGRVVNAVTGVPVGRALVVAAGNEAAMFTDDRGDFALKISESKAAVVTMFGERARRRLEVRKPGFLELSRSIPYSRGSTEGDAAEVTIGLVPEALIVGRVEVPGSDGEVQIECELYQKEMQEEREKWSPSRTFRTWANGEFRFSDLRAGTYKLITHEQMDRDSMRPVPGAPMYGYPPIYYPNTTDFSAASAIVVKAGETAQVNLTLARREYYPLQIAVRNAPVGRPMNLQVAPMGTHSPGWSLGYNQADGAIEGMLPDGNYTVQATALGEGQSTGILNFTVSGRPPEGPVLTLVPDAQVAVNVREVFQSQPSNFGNGEGATHRVVGERVMSNVHVDLFPIGDSPGMGSPGAVPAEGSDGHTQVIENVAPGQYRVRVMPGRGYVARMESDGVDLLRQPLVVGLGGAPVPIEITLRDDGGEVDVSLEQAAGAQEGAAPGGENSLFGYVYLLPMDQHEVESPLRGHGSRNGLVKIGQVAPGDYLLVAYDALPELLIGSEMEALESKGKVIHVEAGQTVSVQVKLISESDGK